MIYEIISKYHNLSKQDKHHRFKSWEHCYHFFSSHYKNLKEEKVFDEGCLQLAFYLASWGMMRGGSFLLQKDYRVHGYFLEQVATNSSYHQFYNTEYSLNLEHSSVEGIDNLIVETSNAYIQNISQVNGEEKVLNITDTLASKILLGVYGNVPAYDRYLVDALKLHGIKTQFNEESLSEIVDFYNLHREEFEKCQRLFSREGTHYTPMKLIDMYFWQVGFLMDTVGEHDDELNRIKEFAKQIRITIPGQKTYLKQTREKTVKNVGLTDMVRKYLIEKLNESKAKGLTSVEFKSGDVHRSLQLNNRMPNVCSAMTSLGVYRFEIIHDTPSGMSSTKLIRYYL